MPDACDDFSPNGGVRPLGDCGAGRLSGPRYVCFSFKLGQLLKFSLRFKYYVQTILFFLFKNILHIVAVALYHL
jgi:hypothetical protein